MNTESVDTVDWSRPAAEVAARIAEASDRGAPLVTFDGDRALALLEVRIDSTDRDDGTPGAILEIDPLVASCAPGALELVRCRWTDGGEELTGREIASLGLRFRRFRP
jgi:methionyl-tRNA formyltransferase